MKYKKYSYLLVLILMLLVGMNGVHAWQEKTCYYMSSDSNFKARLTMRWRNSFWESNAGSFLSDYSPTSVDKFGDGNYVFNDEGIINWWNHPNAWPRKKCIHGGGVCFDFKYSDVFAADLPGSSPSCPKYLVAEDDGSLAIWQTDSSSLATKAVSTSRSNGYTAYYGSQTDEKTYYAEFVDEEIIIFEDGAPTCVDYEVIFGDKDDPESIRYMVDIVLGYIRIIVPILVIVLGIIDFAKAVMAGKEDNMKKAQWDFAKRVLMGVAVFFAPLIVDLIMELADIIWAGDYVHCDI